MDDCDDLLIQVLEGQLEQCFGPFAGVSPPPEPLAEPDAERPDLSAPVDIQASTAGDPPQLYELENKSERTANRC